MKCSQCQREFEDAEEVVQYRPGIMGLTGFISLESGSTFCDLTCLRKHLVHLTNDTVEGRIP